MQDIDLLLRNGADKVAINTALIRNPKFLTEAARVFGSQCIVALIEAKKNDQYHWEAYIENGRERTGVDAIQWAREVEDLGAGEICITSIDREGTRRGFELELIQAVAKNAAIPVIAHGGAGKSSHVTEIIQKTNIDGIALSSILHYQVTGIREMKIDMIKALGAQMLEDGNTLRVLTP